MAIPCLSSIIVRSYDGENALFVMKVKMYCLLSVLDQVLQKSHRVDGSQLSVKRYIECLGQSGGSEDPTAFTMPKPAVVHIDPFKAAFMRQSKTACNALVQELEPNFAQFK